VGGLRDRIGSADAAPSAMFREGKHIKRARIRAVTDPPGTVRRVMPRAPSPADHPIRTFVVIALAVTIVVIGMSTFEYMLTAMQADLGFAIDAGNAVALLPEIGGLALVFVAGTLGDHIGRRRMIAAGALVFAAGAVLVTVAPGLPMVTIGRALEGAGGMVAGIVALALLSDTYVQPRQRSVAFGANAAIVPAVFIFAPIAGAWITEQVSWRLVGAGWVVTGIVAAAAALVLLPPDPPASRPEVVTPLLGGIVLTGIAGGCMAAVVAGHSMVLVFAAITVAASIALVIAMRLIRSPGLDLRIPRSPSGAATLAAIFIANAVNLLFFTTLLLQFRFDVGVLALALVMIPVQVLGVAGGFAGGALMIRFGVVPTAVATTLAAGATALLVLPFDNGTAAWVVLGVAALYSLLDAASSGPITARVMNLAAPGEDGAAAAHREAWSSIGAAAGGIVAGILIFGTFQSALAQNLEERGVPPAAAAQVAADVRDAGVVAEVARGYDRPPPGVLALTLDDPPDVADSHVDAFRAAGIATALSYAVAAALLAASAMHRRRRRGT
jgi:MFS family permease